MGKLIYKHIYTFDEARKYDRLCSFEIPINRYYEFLDQDDDQWPEFVFWCQTETLGTIYKPSQKSIWKFEFEEDALAFKLRWL